MTSMCLAWMPTPWSRYTFWTSSTSIFWATLRPMMRRISLGSSWPSVSGGAGGDVLALGHEELLATRHLDDQVFLAVVTGDDDLTGARVFVVDVDAAGASFIFASTSGCGPRRVPEHGVDPA